jgi:6-phosphogluconate dehydrogenase (decarboxylating)
MKVGMIGLGRIGEGMSRRMIEKGIEVWGYSSTNYESACGQYEAGYISGCVTSLEYLVRAVKIDNSTYTSVGKVPGIFQITLSEKKVEDTLDELLPLLEGGDIIIDYSSNDVSKCQELEKYCSKLGISYIFSGVYGAPYAIDSCSKIFQSLSPGNVI